MKRAQPLKTKKQDRKQGSIFGEARRDWVDLPLFTGTPIPAQPEAFAPKEENYQPSLFGRRVF